MWQRNRHNLSERRKFKMDNKELTHWGIKGMRWGIRRFQNSDGSLTSAGKKRYGDSDEKKEESYEDQKSRAIKSGSAAEVLRFKGDLTQQEMNYARERIRWEQDMKSISDKDIADGKNKADKFFSGVEKATNYANTGLKAWNTIANIANPFLDVSLPKFDTNISGGNKKERAAEKKNQHKAEEAANKRKEQEAQKETKRQERAKKREQESEVLTGTVIGSGNSKSSYKTEGSRSKQTVYDAEWKDVSDKYGSSGQSYVKSIENTKILSLPAPREED